MELPGCETLKLTQRGSRLDVVMNRPDQRNAINAQMAAEFADLLDRLRVTRETRLVILRGAGGHFCAGGDIKERSAMSETAKASAGQQGDKSDDPVKVRNEGQERPSSPSRICRRPRSPRLKVLRSAVGWVTVRAARGNYSGGWRHSHCAAYSYRGGTQRRQRRQRQHRGDGPAKRALPYAQPRTDPRAGQGLFRPCRERCGACFSSARL